MSAHPKTRTSPFGSSGRTRHDSSSFYNSKLYASHTPLPSSQFVENPIDAGAVNRIYCKSSETMDDIPDSSVHLMITSPPYNVQKEYEDDMSLDAHRALLKSVFNQTYQKLVTGGRACVNIANVGRKPYLPLHSYIIEDILDIGYYMRGEIIWNKGASAGSSSAWGSWMSASNPVLRDVHEYILVFSKESFSRQRSAKENTIDRDGFLEWTKSVWTFPAASARRIGHPAPFPEELPHRLIQLYTFKGDVVLDPFCGSGTTCVAARKSDRRYIGYDTERSYVELANERLNAVPC